MSRRRPVPSGRRARLALAGVLALAAALRFARLNEQGLLFFDEGQLIFEAHETAGLIAHGLGTLAGLPGSRETLAAAIRRCSITFARPVHTGLLGALLVAAPRLRADQGTLLLSAAAGTAAVLAIWWLGRAWYGEAAGLLAALLLAVAPYHLLYSREGLSDSVAVCWWLVTLGCAARPGHRMVFLSGLAGGLCFGTNFRTLFLPALVLWLILRRPGSRPSWREGVGASALWLAGFLLPLLACESLYWIAAGLARVPVSAYPAGTYAGQFKFLMLIHGGQEFLFKGFGAFPYYVWRWEGIAALLFLGAAVAVQLTRWRGPDAHLNILWLTPWLLFSAYWDNAPRFFVMLIPLFALIKARWLLELGARLPLPRIVVPLLILAGVAVTVPSALRLIPRPTPYLVAAEFLARSGDPRHVTTNARLGWAYFGPPGAAPMPDSPAEARRLAALGFRWAVTDLQVLFGGFDKPEARYATAVWIGDHRRSVLRIPYSPLALAQGVLEQDLTHADARARLTQLEAVGVALHVFDLSRPGTD